MGTHLVFGQPTSHEWFGFHACCATQAAKHPLLVIGAGANRKMTSNMLRQLVDSTGLPFCDTQMGKGVIDSRALPSVLTPYNQSGH